MNTRYAIYFIPEPETALAILGSALLGRDSETGKNIPQTSLAGFSQQSLHALTADARHYGLHATLKAPFFLKKGMTEHDLLLAAARFVVGREHIIMSRLELAQIDSFFALVPPREGPINTLAADAVTFFEPFRAAPSEQELARREAQKLTGRQKALLAEWGYPYVFDEYRFHITLTDKLHDSEEARHMEEGLRAYFAPVRNEELPVASICVCKQIMPDPASRADARQNSNDSAFMPLIRFGFQPSQ